MTTQNHKAEAPAGGRRISLMDAGPIRRLDIPLPEGGGVLVLKGRNGCGKTTGINAVARALGGNEQVGKRDGAISGRVEVDGITLTLGKQVRATGESELTAVSLQGGELLRLFVDPGIKAGDAADAARIKAGLGLARISATPADFVQAVGGTEAMAAITSEADLQTNDPVDLAGRVKRAAEAAARKHEHEAVRLSGEIDRHTKDNDGIPLTDPHDEAQLAAAHEAAVRALSELEATARAAAAVRAQAADARAKLDAADTGGLSLADAETMLTTRRAAATDAQAVVERLRRELGAAEATAQEAAGLVEESERTLKAVQQREAALAGWRDTVARGEGVALVEDAQLLRLRGVVEGAKAAMLHGARVREALARVTKITLLRGERDRQNEQAEHFRNAAAQAEGVLSGLFSGTGSGLQVRDGRLIVEVPGRGEVYFADLSHGQRYRHAIRLATAGCGPGGIIPLDQVGFEGLDPENQKDVWEEARERHVTILTAEASDGELRVEPFEPPLAEGQVA